MRVIGTFIAAAIVALGLAGCAPSIMDYNETPMPREHGQTAVEDGTHKPLQCAPYAREHSGIKIFGDAYTWWDQAAGKYERGALPESGTVMVLNSYAGTERGHLAVVRRVVGPREIRVDHANWLDDGAIYVNDPVEDVSSANDWSVVRVFNLKTGGWGSRLYPVQGFIGSQDAKPQDGPGLTADAGNASRGATALPGEIY